MPKHQSSEVPKFNKPEHTERSVADNDNIEALADKEPEVANDNIKGDHLPEMPKIEKAEPNEREHSEHKHETLPEGPVRDIVESVEHASAGAVVSMHAIMAKRERNAAGHLAEADIRAKTWTGSVKKYFEHSKDVLVLDREELKARGVDEKSANSNHRIKQIIEENKGKKVVMDFSYKIDDVLYKPWEKLGDKLDSVAKLRGKEAEHWLMHWLHNQSGEHKDENEPTVEEVREALVHASQDLQKFRHEALADHELVFGVGDSPMALAFLLFAEKGNLSAAEFAQFSKAPHREHNTIGMVHFTGQNILVERDEKRSGARRLAA